MRDFDVAYHQAERLVDTEISYVLNKAELEQYKGYGFRKVEIVNLDVNTCDKCKALEGEVFSIIDAPVLPIHPRCHCSYCVPEEGDAAEVTASRGDLDALYAEKGVKGYERPRAAGAKQYAPKGERGRAGLARQRAAGEDRPGGGSGRFAAGDPAGKGRTAGACGSVQTR